MDTVSYVKRDDMMKPIRGSASVLGNLVRFLRNCDQKHERPNELGACCIKCCGGARQLTASWIEMNDYFYALLCSSHPIPSHLSEVFQLGGVKNQGKCKKANIQKHTIDSVASSSKLQSSDRTRSFAASG